MRFCPLLPYFAFVLAASKTALAVDPAILLNPPQLSLSDDCHSRLLREQCKENNKCVWHYHKFTDSLDGGRMKSKFCTVTCYRLPKELCKGRNGCSWKLSTEGGLRECVNERFTSIFRRIPRTSTNDAPSIGIQYSGTGSNNLGETSTSKSVMPLLATNVPETLYTQDPTTNYQEGIEWFMAGPTSTGKRAHTSNIPEKDESSTRKRVRTGKVPDNTPINTNEPDAFDALSEENLQRLPKGWLSLGISTDCTVEELEQPGEGMEQIDCTLRL